MWNLLKVNLKMTFRDKQALFWTLLFPTMFIIIFGLFNFESMGTTEIAVVDKADSEISRGFISGLKEVEFFNIQDEEYVDASEAKEVLKEGDLDFVLVIPASFTIPQNDLKVGQEVEVYYDQANTQTNSVILSTLNQFIDEINYQITGAEKIFILKSESIQARNIKYLDMLTPGIIAMAMMSAAIFGISSEIVKYREQKLLKRLTATPLKVRDFLLAQVFSYLILAVIQISLIIAVAKLLYGVNFYGNIFLMYGLALIGSLIFLSIGFTIAGIAKTINAAEAMAQVIFMPLMFLSGVFFPVEALPNFIYQVVRFLPLTPLIEALRAVGNNNAGLADISTQLLLLAGWVIVTFLIASKTFKFSKG